MHYSTLSVSLAVADVAHTADTHNYGYALIALRVGHTAANSRASPSTLWNMKPSRMPFLFMLLVRVLLKVFFVNVFSRNTLPSLRLMVETSHCCRCMSDRPRPLLLADCRKECG